jgi:hypothetical protein
VVKPLSRDSAFALLAAATLAGWSFVLLDRTRFFEPLPHTAGAIGVALMLVAGLGAGLLGGWNRWTLACVAAGGVGLFRLSESLNYNASDNVSLHPRVFEFLWLLPVAIAAGAAIQRVAPRSRALGAMVLASPIVVVAWAGYRQANPIDYRPAEIYHLVLPAHVGLATYRGVHMGATPQQVVAVLGRPDHVSQTRKNPMWWNEPVVDYAYGADDFTFVNGLLHRIVIRDERAATAEGVGVRDNLAIARTRIPRTSCFIGLTDYDPMCSIDDESSPIEVDFNGDPIESIELLNLGN